MLAAGRRLDHEILAEASGIDPRALRDALREAVAAQLVVADEEGRYAFRHALLREVVVDDLLPGERAELHLALARALERRAEGMPAHGGAHLAAGIAHHYLRVRRPAEGARGERPRRRGRRGRARQRRGRRAVLARAPALGPRRRRRGADRAATTSSCCAPPPGRPGASTSPRAPSPTCAPRWPSSATATPMRSAELLEHVAREQFSQGRSADAAETRRSALELLPDGPSKVRATLLASRGQGADARVAPPGGRRGRARRRSRSRAPRATRSPSCARWTAWASRCSGSAATTRASGPCARRWTRMRDGGLVHFLHTHVNFADALCGAGRLARGARRSPTRATRSPPSKGAPRRWLMLLRAELAFEAGDWDAAEAALPSPGRPAMGTTFINDALRRIELALGRGDHDVARARCSTRPTTSPPTRANRSGSGRWARCARSSSGARATSTPPARRSTTRSTGSTSARRTSARMARVAATGVRVEADAAVRARDLGEDPAFAIGSRRGADRARRGVRGGRPAGRGGVPGQRAGRARPRAGRRRPGAVGGRGRRPGRRSGAPTARRRRCAARPRRCSRAASATARVRERR